MPPSVAGWSGCHVSNVTASGAGSLFDCVVNRERPRIVAFDVAGVVVTEDVRRITGPYITINGTTAPSPGTTIRPAAHDSPPIRRCSMRLPHG